MGQLMAKLAVPLQHCSDNVVNILAGRRKRKRSLDSSSTSDELQNSETQSPKKKRLLTTTQYIYQALFKEQKNSDIAVMALGKVWNLHKVYLCQSPYFYSMFNGSWKESCQDFVHIKILDEHITLEALDAVFGSMYSDEIEIDPKAVISVLATATLFHLEGIIDKCAEVMIETINAETAISYYEAACLYGSVNVKKAAMVFLETNLLCIYPKDEQLLRQISVELMTKLVASPDLYVMQTEFSLYTLLRTWMYLRLHPLYDAENTADIPPPTAGEGDGSRSAVGSNANNNNGNSVSQCLAELVKEYFASRSEKRSFLATPEGQQFVPAFQALRTQYLTNHHTDLKIVLNDNIIPKDWLHSHVLTHWHSILKVDHLPEEGPQNLDADVFYKNCMRCGRVLLEPGYQKWRWTGFNFGLDLVLVADSRLLSIRRHHRNEHERLLSLQTKRQFMIRTSVTSINAQRQPTFTQKTEITSLSLEKNQEVTIMLMDTMLLHPLLISVNLLVVPPASQHFKQHVYSNEDTLNTATVPISEIGANCNPAGDAASIQRPGTPTNAIATAERLMLSADDSAVCVVPPSPPNVPSMLLTPPPTHRAASTTSTVSTASSVGSAVSVSSSASDFV